MKINHNIPALVANGHLRNTNNALNKSLEKLSSGYRINRAADDAAGMAISEKMKTQIAGLNQASRNASDGISVIQTAEGALTEVESMLQRCRELSVQATNGTNTASDREAIQKEIDGLMEEIDRISTDTEFNTKALLNGDINRKSYTNNTKVSLVSLSDQVKSKVYGIAVNELGKRATIQGGKIAIGDSTVSPAVTTVTAAQAGSITLNGETIKIEEGDTQDDVSKKLRDVCERVGAQLTISSVTGGGFSYKFESKETGASQELAFYCDNSALETALGLTFDDTKPEEAHVRHGADATITLDTTAAGNFTQTSTVLMDGNLATITDTNGFELQIRIADDLTITGGATAVNISVLEAGPMVLQIGANEGQTVAISIPEVSSETLGLKNLNVLTPIESSKAITLLDNAIVQVSAIRAKLGAYQNRLDHSILSLDTTSQNLSEALSRVEDVDMAEEMAAYTQKNVLSQAGVSMLSQANESPQKILSLLQ